MAKFKDAKGDEWSLNISAGGCMRVRDDCDFDMMDCIVGEGLTKLAMDPVLLMKVAWALIAPQAKERDIEVEEFADTRVEGETFGAITVALEEALVSFARSPALKRMLQTARAKSKEMEDAIAEAGIERLEGIDVKAEVNRLLGTSGEAFSAVPASPA